MEENEYGEILKEVRNELKLTQQEMASSIGISQSQWANYERGMKNPGLGVLKKIAIKHDISMDRLSGIDKNRKRDPGTLADIAKFILDMKEKYEGIDFTILNMYKKNLNRPSNPPKRSEEDEEQKPELRGVRLCFEIDPNSEKEKNVLIAMLAGYEDISEKGPELVDAWKENRLKMLDEIPLRPKTEESKKEEDEVSKFFARFKRTPQYKKTDAD